MRCFHTLTLCLLFASLELPGTAAPPALLGFQVAGAVVKPANYSPQALRDQFKGSLQTITYTRKGTKHTARAVPLWTVLLWTVLLAAQPRLNPRIKNHALQLIILISGHDGYTAAFSFGELSPDFGNHAAWLAVDEDGKPLGEAAAQEAALVVPDDVKAGRWVHAVQRITVVDEAQSGTPGLP